MPLRESVFVFTKTIQVCSTVSVTLFSTPSLSSPYSLYSTFNRLKLPFQPRLYLSCKGEQLSQDVHMSIFSQLHVVFLNEFFDKFKRNVNIPPGPNILQTRQMFLKVSKSIKTSEAPDHESMNKFELAGVLGVYKRKD